MKNKKLLFIPAFACALLLSTGLKTNNLVAAKAESELVTDVVFSSETFSYVEGTTGHFTTCNHTSRWWGTRSFFIPENIPFYRSVDDYDLNEANEHINTGDTHTAKLELKNSVLQEERYLTFYMGGGLNEEKLYVEVIDKGIDGTSATRIDKLTMKDLFNDPKSGETLFLRVVDLNEYLNHYITVRVVDNEPGGWGCFNFGGLKFNQTEKNVRDTLYQYLENAYETQTDADKDAGQYPYIRQRVNELAEYSLFKPTSWQSFESLDFESIALRDYFTDMSSATLTDVMWNNLISSADYYDWVEHMPFNKHGRKFFSTHPGWTGIGEEEQVLLKSNFTVTIDKPYMAFRIASAKANIQLLDATDDTTVLYDFNPAGNVNPFFKDTGVENVITKKSTNCTMTEAFVDVSNLIGRTVKLTIGENATGGGWGLSYIDEIRFNLSVSDIKVDLTDNRIAQQVKDVAATYHGVVLPRYLRGNSSVSEENDSVLTAFNFLGYFYATLREYNGTSMCQLSNETKLALVNKYNAITDEVALSIINTADDFNYNNDANPGNEYFVKDVVIDKEGVVKTMTYLISTTSTNSLLSSLNVRFIANSNTLAFFFSVIAVVLISVITVLFVRRRHLNK